MMNIHQSSTFIQSAVWRYGVCVLCGSRYSYVVCSPEKFLFMTSTAAYIKPTKRRICCVFFPTFIPFPFDTARNSRVFRSYYERDGSNNIVNIFFCFVLYFLIYGRMRELTCAVSSQPLAHSPPSMPLCFSCSFLFFMCRFAPTHSHRRDK